MGKSQKLSRYQEAQPLYQRALAILEQVFGADHPDVAAVCSISL